MPRPGTTTARGYGTTHQRLRADLEPHVRAGLATCAKCHQPIHPHQPWDLGHTDDRTTWTGPEHAHCNRAHGNTLRGRPTPPPPGNAYEHDEW